MFPFIQEFHEPGNHLRSLSRPKLKLGLVNFGRELRFPVGLHVHECADIVTHMKMPLIKRRYDAILRRILE
jgi:hypothetical protein